MVQVDLVFVKSIRNRLAWLSFSLVRTSIPRQRVLGMASFTSACPGMLDGSPSESKSLSLQEEEVRIGFIGAGQINFGAFEGQKAEVQVCPIQLERRNLSLTVCARLIRTDTQTCRDPGTILYVSKLFQVPLMLEASAPDKV